MLQNGLFLNIINHAGDYYEVLLNYIADQGDLREQADTLLVYYEVTESMLSAIAHEKQIKAGNRNKKLQLIERFNPDWIDLYEGLI